MTYDKEHRQNKDPLYDADKEYLRLSIYEQLSEDFYLPKPLLEKAEKKIGLEGLGHCFQRVSKNRETMLASHIAFSTTFWSPIITAVADFVFNKQVNSVFYALPL